MLAQVLSYAPFIGVQVLAKPDQRAAVADFVVGLFLSRIPILLFQAVQAALLPKLSMLVSEGRDDDFRKGVRQLVLIVVGIGVLGVIVGGTIGPFAGRILFGHKFNLGHADVALLALGQRSVHPGARVVAGPDLAARPQAGDGRVVRRHASRSSDARRLHAPAVPAGGDRLDRGRRRERGRRWACSSCAALSGASRRGSLASLVEQIEYGTLEI